ncbi:MAG: ABC transporter substrate-binding protein [Chloroflexi bacterium]|nr:ABC transporter substrate-binding protein [Chloroflexota bacterium]
MRSGSRALFLVALLVGSLLLVSCTTTSTTPSQPGETPKSSPPVGTPTATKPYGSLTISGNFGNGVLDPQGDSGTVFNGVASAFLDTLIDVSSTGKELPALAERWEFAKDGMTLTFYIRRGVKFHDGSDLTGADVKFSLERMFDAKSIYAGAAVWRGAVARVDLIDAYTVALRMKTPQFEFMQGPETGVTAVLPKKYIEEKGIEYWLKNPIGSGPWKVVKYETGERLDLEANENYWGALPQFKNLNVIKVPDESTRVAMLKTGELDLAVVSPDTTAALKAAGLQIFSSKGGNQYTGYVFQDIERPQDTPVGDVRNRKALTLAMNRKEIVDNIFQGYASPTVVYPASPGAYFFDANLMKLDPYDPEQAKKLMAEAGYPNGFSTRIYDTTGVSAVLNMVNAAVEGYWRKAGINAQLVPVTYATINALRRPKNDPQIFNSVWFYPATGGNLAFARMVLTYHSVQGSPRNNTNPKLDELLEKVPTIADPAERKRLAIETVLMAKNEYLSLPMVDVDVPQGASKKIGEISNFYGSDLWGRTYKTITHGK